jgi:hypothetical protein
MITSLILPEFVIPRLDRGIHTHSPIRRGQSLWMARTSRAMTV